MMQDMLVNLYALAQSADVLWSDKKLSKQASTDCKLDEIVIRKLNVYETHLLVDWVG